MNRVVEAMGNGTRNVGIEILHIFPLLRFSDTRKYFLLKISQEQRNLCIWHIFQGELNPSDNSARRTKSKGEYMYFFPSTVRV